MTIDLWELGLGALVTLTPDIRTNNSRNKAAPAAALMEPSQTSLYITVVKKWFHIK